MTHEKTTPYGSWHSPISSTSVALAGRSVLEIHVSDDHIYWLEMRPHEGGRYVVMNSSLSGPVVDITPPDFNIRTRVHEYGGGSYIVHESTIYFSNYSDQRIYRLDSDQLPLPITPEPEIPAGLRYADGQVTPDGRFIICVREQHTEDNEATNALVAIPTDGSAPPRIVTCGHDFYSTPRLSPNGQRLAWLTWDHPQMPWDGTELWVGEVLNDGSIQTARKVAGGSNESIFQPEWSPQGILHFISDRSGWWNLYFEDEGQIIPLAPIEADLGVPQWQFGYSRYTFLSGGRVACIYSQDGQHHLGLIYNESSVIKPLKTDFSAIFWVKSGEDDNLYCVAGNFKQLPSVVCIDTATEDSRIIYSTTDQALDIHYLSIPRPIEFPTDGELDAYALFYPPLNPEYIGPPDELPPLLVISHGGPTGEARPYLQMSIQYWTSRGIAVVDVNYGGSAGYGRDFRERLNGQWGVTDTIDCINAARHLVDSGEVDGSRLIIRGGSAGGYTTLCALTFQDFFSAGASYYGVADVEALAVDTHKFESRYLEGLIGPYPEMKDLYHSRSPIHFTDRLTCPVILFQGLEDMVVPPSQAEIMVKTLGEKGLPFAYLAFEGEQHGFRKAETIQRCLEAELFFYARIFGFELTEDIEPIHIENL
jgi:dipeptidyl aminopeptidase/acylaminoacyl peptidase